MGKNEVIDVVRQYKDLVVSAMGPAEVYLYGSYSTGKAHKDSDIDVAVIVPTYGNRKMEISRGLWTDTRNVSFLIEPVLIAEDRPSPLYDDVMQTGVVV